MEQQKTLWIIFSVTLFLVVVVVVGFVWFLPPDSDGELEAAGVAAGSQTSSKVFDPIVWVRGDKEVPRMSEDAAEPAESAAEDLLLVYGETRRQPETALQPITPDRERIPVTVLETPPARTDLPALVPEKSVAARPAEAPAEPRAAVRPAATPVAKPEPRPVRVTQYWIQAGSFQSQTRAEQAQAALAEKGWHTRITSRDVDGEVFFRVRLGPFETNAEANKFLEWISGIDSFELSYVSEVYTTRRIN